ncbi:50S ribosomal protein L32 [Phosphitispora fastidiosa]|uniref:50S ribosomal protein L32 n=1 Tax=Phosphitispora fastidiosa TaxID=2837202 RepID=UPI001E421285|nr:50S ribosomal protein L32 [Phosphitispora fastidiosa]MBU7005488.1 large subunit ribosomal protein L32 [Phosphitispora fastidiosa]
MGVPKRRHSKTRKNMRRAQQKIEAPRFILCPQCHEPKMPHRVCPGCGYYKDKEVIATVNE